MSKDDKKPEKPKKPTVVSIDIQKTREADQKGIQDALSEAKSRDPEMERLEELQDEQRGEAMERARLMLENHGIDVNAPKVKVVNVDASLEALIEKSVVLGIEAVREKHPSEVKKDVQDIALRTTIHVALRLCRMPSKINSSVSIWDTQLACNVMGVAHRALLNNIKIMVENGELVPPDETGQEDLFEKA